MALERVQKILAQSGIASRRKAEELITEGVVTVNGKVAQLGDKADLTQDAIKVRGKLLQGREPETYLAFYKPRAVISMLADPEGRSTITDYLKRITTRVFPIGRLDYLSEGLILLTNDGDFAEKIQRRDDIPRVYHVKVKGHPNEEMLERLRRGARFGNRLVQPQSVRLSDEYSNKARIEIVIVGSGAVDLKAFVESRGFLVEKITRSAIGHITIKGLVPGALRVLEKSQVEALLNQPELGTRMIERDQTKRARFHATSEEDREKSRARARGEKPRLKKIQERQDEYREKIGAAPKFRARSEEASSERSERAPRAERSARPERAERSSRFERPSRPERTERAPRAERSARPERAERSSRTERPERSERFSRTERPERSDRRAAPSRTRTPRDSSSLQVKFGRPRRDDDAGFAPRKTERGYGRAPERSERSERGFGRAPERSERREFSSSRAPRRSDRDERGASRPERRAPRADRGERSTGGRASFGDRPRRGPRRGDRD